MDVTTWFKTWLTRHPLKEPTVLDPAQYTAEVMAQVKRSSPVETPASVRRWLAWPRLALVAATAAAGVALIVGTVEDFNRHIAGEVRENSEVLAALDEPAVEPFLSDDVDTLADELETTDVLLLAEASPSQSDDQWLDETLQLLEQLDEDEGTPADTSGGSSDDDWLEQLKLIDESDLAASS